MSNCFGRFNLGIPGYLVLDHFDSQDWKGGIIANENLIQRNLDLAELIGLRLSAKWCVAVACFGDAFLVCKNNMNLKSRSFNCSGEVYLWSNWPSATRIADPLLSVWRSRMHRVWLHLRATFVCGSHVFQLFRLTSYGFGGLALTS